MIPVTYRRSYVNRSSSVACISERCFALQCSSVCTYPCMYALYIVPTHVCTGADGVSAVNLAVEAFAGAIACACTKRAKKKRASEIGLTRMASTEISSSRRADATKRPVQVCSQGSSRLTRTLPTRRAGIQNPLFQRMPLCQSGSLGLPVQ